MLVITRREGEEVVIGDPNNPIGVVRIASIKGDRVRVAFDFPRSITVHRREVADQVVAGQPQHAPEAAPAQNGSHAQSPAHQNGSATPNGHAGTNGHVVVVTQASAQPAK